MEPRLDEVIRELNEQAAEHADQFEAGGSLRLRWGFMCECGDAHCITWVEM
jgi:hypothetical protein